MIGNGHPGPVPRPERLPAGRGAVVRAHGHHHHRGADLRQGPRHRGPACERHDGPSTWDRPSTWSGAATPSVAFAVLIYLFVPIFVIVVFSFNKPKGKFNASGSSSRSTTGLHPFAEQATTRDALITSLKVALIVVASSPRSSARSSRSRLSRYRFRGQRRWSNILLVLPLTTPEIVLGASLLHAVLRPQRRRSASARRHRPHHVLRELRGAHREGAHPRLRLDARGRRAWTSARRRCARSGRSRFPLILPGHPRRRAAVVRAVDRRLHHHLVRRRRLGDHLPHADLRIDEDGDPAADARHRHRTAARERHLITIGTLRGLAKERA